MTEQPETPEQRQMREAREVLAAMQADQGSAARRGTGSRRLEQSGAGESRSTAQSWARGLRLLVWCGVAVAILMSAAALFADEPTRLLPIWLGVGLLAWAAKGTGDPDESAPPGAMMTRTGVWAAAGCLLLLLGPSLVAGLIG